MFLLSLFWFVLWVWFVAFCTRPWLNDFGAAAFVVTGLLIGVIYFFSFYEWYKRIRDEVKTWKRRLSYFAEALWVIFVSLLLTHCVLWVGDGMGNAKGIAFWFFVGFIISGFVLYTNDRLFRWLKAFFI